MATLLSKTIGMSEAQGRLKREAFGLAWSAGSREADFCKAFSTHFRRPGPLDVSRTQAESRSGTALLVLILTFPYFTSNR